MLPIAFYTSKQCYGVFNSNRYSSDLFLEYNSYNRSCSVIVKTLINYHPTSRALLQRNIEPTCIGGLDARPLLVMTGVG